MCLPHNVGWLWSCIIMDVFMSEYFKKGLITFDTEIHETVVCLYDIIWKELGNFLILCLKGNLKVVRRYVSDFILIKNWVSCFPTLCYPSQNLASLTGRS
jgi:hypothetical protein